MFVLSSYVGFFVTKNKPTHPTGTSADQTRQNTTQEHQEHTKTHNPTIV